MCPASPNNVLVPPLTEPGHKWRATNGQKSAGNPLRIELPERAKEWFERRGCANGLPQPPPTHQPPRMKLKAGGRR